MTIENRRHARVNVDVQAIVRRDIDPDFSDMMMSNLSLGGCFIKTDAPEAAGSVVTLRFTLPGEGGDGAIKAVGKVCWVKTGGDGPKGMGIQFVTVDEADLGRLMHYISGMLTEDLFGDD
jgi:uncharacterized protein (TIGR02266 family)